MAVGIAFLGAAYSWALGTDRRIIHWLFLIFGLLLLVPAALDACEWPQKKLELIEMDNTSIDAEKLLVQEDDRKNFVANERNLERDQQELRALQAEGIVLRVMNQDWGTVVAGLLLVGSGLGLLIGINRADHSSELPDLKKQVGEHHIN